MGEVTWLSRQGCSFEYVNFLRISLVPFSGFGSAFDPSPGTAPPQFSGEISGAIVGSQGSVPSHNCEWR